MKRVIVTGATGFVGANLARRLIHEGHEVYLLVRPSHTSWRIHSIRQEIRLYEVDFADAVTLTNTVRIIRPDWIFHLAAHGAYSWQTNLSQMIETNINGTINLVQACLKIGFEAFVNTGSSSEYGYKDHAPAETEGLEPNSHYALTKATATMFCRYTAQNQNVHIPTLRLYSVYGPFEEPNRLVPSLILSGLQGKWPPLTNPTTARDFVYVDDVSEAYLLAATHPTQEWGPIYNLGAGLQLSLRDVVEIARRVLDIKAEPAWGSMPARQWDTSVWVANNSKLQQKLGWQPRYDFEQGFKATTEWFRSAPGIEQFYSVQLKDLFNP